MKKRRNRNKWIFVTTADMKQFYIAAKASACASWALPRIPTMDGMACPTDGPLAGDRCRHAGHGMLPRCRQSCCWALST